MRDGEGLDWLASRDAIKKHIPAILYTSDNGVAEKAAAQGVKYIDKIAANPAAAILAEIEQAFDLPARSQQPAPPAAATGEAKSR